jgi:putative endonuclease
MTEWFVYLLACADGSLYCGVTTDPWRREQEHREGRGARYTRSRRVMGLVWLCGASDKSEALRLEIAVKRQPASLKRLLASGGQ